MFIWMDTMVLFPFIYISFPIFTFLTMDIFFAVYIHIYIFSFLLSVYGFIQIHIEVFTKVLYWKKCTFEVFFVIYIIQKKNHKIPSENK